jgi:radical SAM superfamily enzyme YgiQ (UPF0313 family)
MRLAVVLPPLRDFYLSPRRLSALGSRTLIRLLEKAGHTVVSPGGKRGEPFLFPLKGKSHPLPLPPEAAYLEPWIIPGECGPLSFFTSMKRFGPAWTDCARAVAAEKPEAVLISSFAYAYAEDAVLLAAALRGCLPDTPIISGGAGPSAWPDYYLHPPPWAFEGEPPGNRPVFDAVFAGEAETGLPLLLDFLARPDQAKAEPLLLRAAGYAPAEDLDCVFAIQRETPAAAWVSLCLSRGCPMACKFCSARLCHGSQLRVVPLQKIEKAAQALSRRIEGKKLHLNFEDDNMLLDPAWFNEVMRIFHTRFPHAAFAAENGLDYRLLDPGAAARLIDLGFGKFNLSLGSACETTAAAENRETDIPGYSETASLIAARGIPLTAYFIAGLQSDTPESVIRNLTFLAHSPALAGISLFYPVPGIAGFDPPPENLRHYPGLARGSLAHPWTGSLRTEQLVTAFRLARLVNLMKKPNRDSREEELLARCFSEKKLYTLKKDSGTAHPRLVSVPADREMEKLFFQQFRH